MRQLPPALLADLPADLPLQTLVVAGEACAAEVVGALVAWAADDQRLWPDRDDSLRQHERCLGGSR